MSTPKPCEGIVLTPVKFTPVEPAAQPTTSRYIPPFQKAAMKKEAPTLTKDDIISTSMFPTLSGTVWKDTKDHTATPMNQVIEAAIEREKKAIEEGIRERNERDLDKMSKEQLLADGWTILNPETTELTTELPYCAVTDTDALYLQSGWGEEITEMMMQQPEVFLKHAQCVYADGSPIERRKIQTKKLPMHTYAKPIYTNPVQQFWNLAKSQCQ